MKFRNARCHKHKTTYFMGTNPEGSDFSGHRKRLRARLECEPQAVADYEVLELVLGLALVRRDTKPLARVLIARFGSLRGVLDAREDELQQVEGFGPGLMSLWRLIREVMARYALAPLLKRDAMISPEAVAQVARQRLGNYSHEESWLALVDAQNRLISWERLRKGSISSVTIHPRDVLEVALIRKASGIILVHNHPGGSAHPSRPDLDLTEEIKSLATRLGLRFLDHLIITPGECYSIAQKGIIRE